MNYFRLISGPLITVRLMPREVLWKVQTSSIGLGEFTLCRDKCVVSMDSGTSRIVAPPVMARKINLVRALHILFSRVSEDSLNLTSPDLKEV